MICAMRDKKSLSADNKTCTCPRTRLKDLPKTSKRIRQDDPGVVSLLRLIIHRAIRARVKCSGVRKRGM